MNRIMLLLILVLATGAINQNDKPRVIVSTDIGGSDPDDFQSMVHFAPDIKNNIRVYFIGSWNTREDEKSRDYLFNNHPDMWWIENNTTFRGKYMGGSFVKTGHGPNYWTDNMDPALVENNREGAKTVNRFRQEYLSDWKNRMSWLKD